MANNNRNTHTDYLRVIGRSGRSNNPEVIKFDEYLERCIDNPDLARTSTQRIYDMIISHGVVEDEVGNKKYNFFHNKMFGSEEPIRKIMEYFEAASLGLDIKKRVLLLLGPPGGGKSMFLTMLKEGLARYTKSEKGAMYKIKNCPINEDPLNLIEDPGSRREIWEKHNIRITGKPCPYCKYMLETDWKNNLSDVEVERFSINEETRTGIGTFAPAEENDMTELYGSINLRRVEEYGNEADPRVYDFTGELQKANRGIMEFIEVLKADPDFLHVLLTLAEEEQFKTPRFPLISVDEALIAHTNEGEFDRFISVRENEAVIDRLFIVRMPYNMDSKDEELIYHSALKTKLVVKGKTIHPGAIRFASDFVVLTRYSDTKDKLRDGMQGLSPRFILNALALSMVRVGEGVKMVKPYDMFKVLFDMIENYPILDKAQRSKYLNMMLDLFKEKQEEYNNLRMSDVRLEQLNDRGITGLNMF